MKNKRKIISIIAALLCICTVICATGCSNGLTDKFKDIFGEETETQGGNNYTPNKKPVLVPDDTSMGNDTLNSEPIIYKEVLTQDSNDLWIDWTYFGGDYVYYSFFTRSLFPDTKYIVEWELQDSVHMFCGPIYDSVIGKSCVFVHQNFGTEISLGDVVASFDGFNWEVAKTGFVEFTTSSDCGLFAFTVLCSEDDINPEIADQYCDFISDNLLLRISKVE